MCTCVCVSKHISGNYLLQSGKTFFVLLFKEKISRKSAERKTPYLFNRVRKREKGKEYSQIEIIFFFSFQNPCSRLMFSITSNTKIKSSFPSLSLFHCFSVFPPRRTFSSSKGNKHTFA